MPRRSAAAVAETRTAVTEAAVDRASVEGLDGLTIGALADEVSMRKSSVFTLFGSKEELQLATLRAAIDQFRHGVWQPVADRPPGKERLLALCDSWLAYHERESLPGGCFLTTATVEYDARPGSLRDAVAETMDRWLRSCSSRRSPSPSSRASCHPTPSRPTSHSSSTPWRRRPATGSSSPATRRSSRALGARCGGRSAPSSTDPGMP